MTQFAASTKRFAVASIWIVLMVLPIPCSSDSEQDDAAEYSKQSLQCLECHDVTLDSPHRLDCLQCHQPLDKANGLSDEHPPIIAMPSHPESAERVCGSCHDLQTAMVMQNDHYLLTGHIETIRSAFSVDSASDNAPVSQPFPVSAQRNPETVADLVDDLLSRRCLRCHVYNSGDPFPLVSHGTGCASCHLAFADGTMISHEFIAKPPDDRCLSCHYGNHVGFDYYGRYEHDLNEEYRTPYYVNTEKSPPFGVEYHQLSPDVHQAAGMLCIDCHTQEDVMGNGLRPSCSVCHHYQSDQSAQPSLSQKNGETFLTSRATGSIYLIPQAVHEAHERYGDWFSCQVCHAQWSFNDGSVHLLRIDHEEFDDFYKLSVDGSYEAQRIIASHISEDGDLLEPFMTDKFTGLPVSGIWFRGFIERRWERMQLIADTDGKIHTARPILDMHLSWIDEDEQVRFDNISPDLPTLRTYAPHTVGKAGLFYEQRIRPFLDPQ